ncbi:MAG: hypothetical protein K9L94_00665 [Candidatus Omnitrophica bacterium]|nr:hypothetical protein [Candidatus Omnitrophota bacterium]
MFQISVYDTETASSVFKKEVSKVVLPGKEGQLSIWDFHQPMVASLEEGLVSIDKEKFIEIKEGIAKIQSNELVLMVVLAKKKEDENK